jgi:octaheme c-type cytochrome (tetrathionate reductase family)
MLGLALAFALAGLFLGQPVSAQETTPVSTPEPGPTVDHSQLPALQGPFATPQDVTKACLSCHTDAADQIMHTTHWTWEYVNETTGQTVGKKTLINNFCIDIQSNEPRCTSCHVGYGWKDKNYDFSVQENVDCLVCHDSTGEYKKFPTGAGLPVSEPKEFPVGSGTIWNPPDLAKVAQNVGVTSRQTCGSCHFYGGGGDEVKHGDLDSSLVNPSFELDVHMSAEGQNFTCTTCHMTADHQIVGSRYSMDPEQWKGCESCHGEAPHQLASLNQHSQKLACQTCHIPEYARGGIPTKMTWDWSKAGELVDGKPVVRKDDTGHVIYDGQKGEFTVQEDVIPEYVWFNGQVEYTLAGDKIDPTGVVNINKFLGDINDPNAKIWPVKPFHAVQPYDSGNDILAVPHLFGKDEFAYWGNYDWNKAITFGMEYTGLPYSGEYDFVESVMYWPITHMVAPASEAVTCRECHTEEESRLDFAALGYSEADVTRLTNFPPVTMVEVSAPLQSAPESCVNCHEGQHTEWAKSTHGTEGVGCVSCHLLTGEGEHPAVPFSVEKTAETCGSCHIQEYEEMQQSKHGEAGMTCNACHNPHSQELMTVDGNSTACVNCHKEQADPAAAQGIHASHLNAADMDCKSCHINEEHGHSFGVSLTTCTTCHEEGVPAETTAQPVETAVEEAKPTGIQLPAWTTWLAALLIGTLAGWGIFGREPGGSSSKK